MVNRIDVNMDRWEIKLRTARLQEREQTSHMWYGGINAGQGVWEDRIADQSEPRDVSPALQSPLHRSGSASTLSTLATCGLRRRYEKLSWRDRPHGMPDA